MAILKASEDRNGRSVDTLTGAIRTQASRLTQFVRANRVQNGR
ncbi:hypothetical protein [Methylobacterium sp. J-070]|nr:hypothetical protein [Methylobacterium sp. J-070]